MHKALLYQFSIAVFEVGGISNVLNDRNVVRVKYSTNGALLLVNIM